MITLKQLEAFFWINQMSTFERAAAKLNTSQSTITKRIQELEAAVGVPLFDRTARTARITGKGEQLLAIAEEMLALQQQASSLSDREVLPMQTLRLGVTELTALTWLPSFVAQLRDQFPDLLIETHVDMSRELVDRLLDDRLDLVLVPDAYQDPMIEQVPLARSRNSWMGSPDLVRVTETVPIEQLVEYRILMQSNRSGTGHFVSRWLRSEGVVARHHVFSDSLIALLGMTAAGLGITYLPRDCFEPQVREGKLVEIPTTPALPDIPYVTLFRRDRPSAFIRSVADIGKACCDFSQQLQLSHYTGAP
ncbi:LysR family transcriptional regulator [Roseicyclus sp. F158]|uniref:LysR family transcriptional regulator n=1 Tax=Tropicimonas omnivorans TaxID=3075590 RepID=A0ABU3DLN5_9RHOB|nr:LysR family transcriptional regulator [Roseicyclus sp. F158]MDT0684576.1 LysR family transcriptional regulator [Roseicyclus sp. F158]